MDNPTDSELLEDSEEFDLKVQEWAKMGCPVTCGHCNHAIYPIGLGKDIEAALREAEQRGMRRAAGIARRYDGLQRVVYRNKDIPPHRWPGHIANEIECAAKEE